MPSKSAEEIIKLEEREWAKQSNFRNLWQQTADLVFPRENQITTLQATGTDKTVKVYDPTAILDSQDMASGLSAAFIPSGQQFFGLIAKNKALSEIDVVSRYLSNATRITHEELFESNFMLQLNETLRSLIVFGTGNLYSEWDNKKLGLNFKDWDITFYQILEDNHGLVDTILLKYPMTARQAFQEFGDKAGQKVLEALAKPETENKVFDFIHYVAPRENRNLNLSDTYNLNMLFESVFVNVKEKIIVEEGGFPEFAFAVCRWMKSSHEKWGRGQGTESLSAVKELQQMHKDFVECGNKWNNPPKEILDTFEGTVDVRPNALNFVQEKGTIRAIEQQVLGNFPITKEMLLFQQEIIHKAFFVDVFAPLANLPGDRRTTVEIYQRVKQAMKKLASPVYRVQSELFTPVITRCVLLLIRNGKIPLPPPELQGQGFGIEYISELALALRNQEAKAFMEWSTFVAEMEAVFPGAKDNIDSDSAIRRMGRSFGVNEEDMSSEEEVEAKRAARAQEMAAMQAMEAAGAAAEGYKKVKDAPETGSPAEALMSAVTGE